MIISEKEVREIAATHSTVSEMNMEDIADVIEFVAELAEAEQVSTDRYAPDETHYKDAMFLIKHFLFLMHNEVKQGIFIERKQE